MGAVNGRSAWCRTVVAGPLALAAAGAIGVACGGSAGAVRGTAARPVAASGDAGKGAASSALGSRRKLEVVAQVPLTDAPDFVEPHGRFVGKGARADAVVGKTAPPSTCDVWDGPTGLYRGSFPLSVCRAWESREHATVDGKRVLVQDPKTRALHVRASGAAADAPDLATVAAPPCKSSGTSTKCPQVAGFAFSPDGAEIAAVWEGDKTVRVFAATTGQPSRALKLGADLAVLEGGGSSLLGWNADADELSIVAGDGGATKIVRFEGGKGDGAVEDLHWGVPSVTLDPFGNFAFVSGDDVGEISHPFHEVQAVSASTLLSWDDDWRPGDAAAPARWSRDGRSFASEIGTLTHDDTTRHVLFVALDAHPSKPTFLDSDAIGAVGIDASGKRVALVGAVPPPSSDGLSAPSATTLKVWQPPTATPAFVDTVPAGAVTGVSFAPDGKRVAIARGSQLEVRRVDPGGAVELFWANVESAAWSPTEPLLAAVLRKGKVSVRDLATRTASFTSPDAAPPAKAVAWSDDGQAFAVLDAAGVTLYDTTAWRVKRRLAAPAIATASEVAFAPGGALVVAASSAREATVFEVASGAVRAQLSGDGAPASKPPARAVRAFFAPKDRVVVVDAEGTVAVWDVAAKKLLVQRATGVDDPASVSPDGAFAVVRSDVLVRLSDGAALRLLPNGVVVPDTGAYDGDDAVVDDLVLRAGDDGLAAPLLRGAQLRGALRRPGLFADFLEGKPIARPSVVDALAALPPKVTLGKIERDEERHVARAPVTVADDGADAPASGATYLSVVIDDAPPVELAPRTAFVEVPLPVAPPTGKKARPNAVVSVRACTAQRVCSEAAAATVSLVSPRK